MPWKVCGTPSPRRPSRPLKQCIVLHRSHSACCKYEYTTSPSTNAQCKSFSAGCKNEYATLIETSTRPGTGTIADRRPNLP